jgi:hypothetical protein
VPPQTYDPGTRTGVEAVDRFLFAIENDDAETVAAMLQYRPIPCVDPETAEYQVACPPGAAEGTPVRAFVFSACHGGWVGEEYRHGLAAELVDRDNRLFAVYRVPGHAHPAELDPPDRQVLLVLAHAELGWGSLYWFSSSGMLSDIALGCGHDVAGMVDFYQIDPTETILAPVQ